MSTATPWAVVIKAGDYAIREIGADELLSPDIVAAHPDRSSAERALERVEAMHQAVLEQLRAPLAREAALRARIEALPNAGAHPDLVAKPLADSLAHDAEVRNRFLVAIAEIARPRQKSPK